MVWRCSKKRVYPEEDNDEIIVLNLAEKDVPPEQFLAEQKSSIRKKSWWAVGIGGFVVLVHIAWLVLFGLAGADPDFSMLFRSIFFILGLFAFVAGIWGFYYARSLTLKDIIPSPQAIEFVRQSQAVKPYYTYLTVGCIVVVFIAQLSAGLENSIDAAGFVKPEFWRDGEYWRILTGGVLHGGFLHIYFNSQAMYGFGSLLEFLSNRAHLAIVFVLSVVGGGLLSLVFMPDGKSVGASGGIMGLIGYMAVYGYRRKQQLPPDFLKSMLINIGFIAAFGVIAYQLVDNFAHAGGLVVGAFYAIIQVPRNLEKDPRKAGRIIEVLGMIASAIIVGTAFLAVLKIIETQ